MHPYILSFIYLIAPIRDFNTRIEDLLVLISKSIEPRNILDSLTKACDI